MAPPGMWLTFPFFFLFSSQAELVYQVFDFLDRGSISRDQAVMVRFKS